MGKMSIRGATKGLSSQVDTHLTFLEAGWKVLYLLAEVDDHLSVSF